MLNDINIMMSGIKEFGIPRELTEGEGNRNDLKRYYQRISKTDEMNSHQIKETVTIKSS